MHVVGSGECERALEPVPDACALDEDGRHHESKERQPRHRRKHEKAAEVGHRQEDGVPGDDRDNEFPHLGSEPVDKHDSGDVRTGKEERTHGQHEGQVPPTRKDREADAGPRRSEAESQRRPEMRAVEADRLRDELADGSLRRRQGGRQRLLTATGSHPPNATRAAC